MVGSSSSSKSERQISACARFKRIRQPPENWVRLQLICS
ncbi:Uncharacterised protein [Vibrio cholerae]|nr:Uncharacterised protein [Vibrio cholerae]